MCCRARRAFISVVILSLLGLMAFGNRSFQYIWAAPVKLIAIKGGGSMLGHVARIPNDIPEMKYYKEGDEVGVLGGLRGSFGANCQHGPTKNLFFLKTHKTGSSTLQNILVRYANKKNLFVGLPNKPIHFNYQTGKAFNRSFMKSVPPGREVNILLHHMVFNYNEVRAAVPEDTVYITIARDPATQFESVFKYFRHITHSFRRIKSGVAFEDFLRHPKRYFKGNKDGNHWWFGQNNQFFDLGYDNLNDTDEYIRKSITTTEKIFDFVIISEYFEISLLLLKDLLCWNMDDVLYLSLNARDQSTVKPVNLELAQKIYDWNKADTALYKHFNRTFWQRVEAYGHERIKEELKELQFKKERLKHFCVENELRRNKRIKNGMFKMYSPPGLEITQYELKEEAKDNETCIELILPEMQWYHKLNCRQYSLPCGM